MKEPTRKAIEEMRTRHLADANILDQFVRDLFESEPDRAQELMEIRKALAGNAEHLGQLARRRDGVS